MKTKHSATEIIAAIRAVEENNTNEGIDSFDVDNLKSFLERNYSADNWNIEIDEDINHYNVIAEKSRLAIKYSIYGGSALISLLASLNLSNASSNDTMTTAYNSTQLSVAITLMIIKYICQPIVDQELKVISRLNAVKKYAHKNNLSCKPSWVDLELVEGKRKNSLAVGIMTEKKDGIFEPASPTTPPEINNESETTALPVNHMTP